MFQTMRQTDRQTNKQEQVKMKILFALEFARVDFQLSADNAAYVQCQQIFPRKE